jgi:hypothetical protein
MRTCVLVRRDWKRIKGGKERGRGSLILPHPHLFMGRRRDGGIEGFKVGSMRYIGGCWVLSCSFKEK